MRLQVDPIEIKYPEDDWMTKYDGKTVGKYLNWFYKQNMFKMDELIEVKPGQIVMPPPQPNLEGFLMWVAKGVDQ